jgi:hypothetical protein
MHGEHAVAVLKPEVNINNKYLHLNKSSVLFRGMTALYFENHTKHINTHCGQEAQID